MLLESILKPIDRWRIKAFLLCGRSCMQLCSSDPSSILLLLRDHDYDCTMLEFLYHFHHHLHHWCCWIHEALCSLVRQCKCSCSGWRFPQLAQWYLWCLMGRHGRGSNLDSLRLSSGSWETGRDALGMSTCMMAVAAVMEEGLTWRSLRTILLGRLIGIASMDLLNCLQLDDDGDILLHLELAGCCYS